MTDEAAKMLADALHAVAKAIDNNRWKTHYHYDQGRPLYQHPPQPTWVTPVNPIFHPPVTTSQGR